MTKVKNLKRPPHDESSENQEPSKGSPQMPEQNPGGDRGVSVPNAIPTELCALMPVPHIISTFLDGRGATSNLVSSVLKGGKMCEADVLHWFREAFSPEAEAKRQRQS